MPSSGAAKFYTGGINAYPEEEVYRETAFIAYYLHWTTNDIWAMPHEERRRWCAEISKLHQAQAPRTENPFAI